MKKAIRILLVGAKGRMGKAIAAAAENRSEVTISGKVDRNDPLDLSIHDSDVVIDFSQTEATELVCRTCLENKKPLVLGTTGHTEEQIKLIEAAAQSVPILFAPNFSIGVNTLFWLTRKAAEVVGLGFRCGDCRDASPIEKRFTEWNGETAGGNFNQGALA